MTLIDFILKAKLSGYASGGEGQERKFDDGSVGFEIVSDGFRYLDRYHGFNPFAGSEQIFDSNGIKGDGKKPPALCRALTTKDSSEEKIKVSMNVF